MKFKDLLDKWLDYLPLLTILGFLTTFMGAARRLDDIYYYTLGFVVLPVWIFLIITGLKIIWKKKTGGGKDTRD